jgi:tetratricopeptide (TPR) repeat protein
VRDTLRSANSDSIRSPSVAADAIQPRALPGGGLRSIVKRCWFFLVLTTALAFPARSQTADFSSLGASADAARQRGDIPKAMELYRKATTENPNWPDGWWFLGILQYDANQYVAAQEALNRYLQLTPNAAPALALRGLCEFNTRNYPQALQDLELAESLGAANQPRNARIIYYHEALLLTRLGRFEEALGKFQILARQSTANGGKNGTDDQDLLLAVGLAGLRMNLFPDEVKAEQAAILSSVGRAAVLLMNQDDDGSRQAFQSIFAQYPRVPNSHYLYGYLLFATKPDEAISQFREELAISPHSAHARAMCAWALEFQGDYAAALDDAAKAATDDPSLPMAQLVYGRALVETGDIAGGLPHLENVLRSEPGNLEAHLTLVKAYSKLGRSEDARRERLLCLSISQEGAAPIASP